MDSHNELLEDVVCDYEQSITTRKKKKPINRGLRTNAKTKLDSYKPLKDSSAQLILLSIYKHEQSYGGALATKDGIKEKFLELVKSLKVMNWIAINTLLKHEFVTVHENADSNHKKRYGLTACGRQYCERTSKKAAEASSCPIIIRVQESEPIIINYQEQQQISNQKEDFYFEEEEKKNENNGEFMHDHKTSESLSITQNRIFKSDIKNLLIVLYVDNREIKNEIQKTIIYEQLILNGIQVELKNLPVGDFLWTAEVATNDDQKATYMLDYIVERKTAADLFSSIIDGRYKDQKYRLARSKIKHVYYLIEGTSATENVTTIEKAIQTTRIVDRFKIQRSRDLEDSINWLSQLTYAIQKKSIDYLTEYGYLEFESTYCKFCSDQNSFRKHPKLILSQMLRNIEGCGAEFVAVLTARFDSFKEMYENLNAIPSNLERQKMLKQLSSRLSKKTIDRIISLFCVKDYCE